MNMVNQGGNIKVALTLWSYDKRLGRFVRVGPVLSPPGSTLA